MEHELKCNMPLAEVTGLRSGCMYKFRVQAFNEVGNVLFSRSYCIHATHTNSSCYAMLPPGQAA